MQSFNYFRLFVFCLAFLIQISYAASQEEFSSKVHNILDQAVAEYGIPGMAVLARNAEGETFVGASGFADLESQTPLTAQHRFRIASISKTFVATVVMQLVEESKLALDETIDHWLDASIVDAIPNGHSMTLRHLLSHTSGMYDFEDEAFIDLLFEDTQKQWTPQDLIQHALEHGEPYFEPGQGYQYSNTNYILLGLIIENVSASTLEEQIRTRILNPLHLDNTFSGEEDYPQEGNATSYWVQKDSTRVKIVDLPLYFEWGHGHMISTVEDLAVFFKALVDGQLFQKVSTLDEMITMTKESGYTYGLGISHSRVGYGHTGGTFAFISLATYIPETGAMLIYWKNELNMVKDEVFNHFFQQVLPLILPSNVDKWRNLK